MIAARDGEHSAVELKVTQPVGGNLVERRRRDNTAERAGDTEADIVGHNEQDVRRALRRHHTRWPIRPP